MKPTVRDNVLSLLENYRALRSSEEKVTKEYSSTGRYQEALVSSIKAEIYKGLIEDLEQTLN